LASHRRIEGRDWNARMNSAAAALGRPISDNVTSPANKPMSSNRQNRRAGKKAEFLQCRGEVLLRQKLRRGPGC
ncbi:hypothetical protein, partial [Mesorhizobium sp. M0676]|uniref:hypothetical protein n=1 Tax=Mesorhizobium sp. M0676 TaxID=2956984 RepID=UPI00333DD427